MIGLAIIGGVYITVGLVLVGYVRGLWHADKQAATERERLERKRRAVR